MEAKKILIVEDDVFIQDVYNVKFSQEGFEVIVAENGVDALEILKSFIPDVIMLDIMMPRVDGVEVLKKIKSENALKDIPIMILTNISEKEKMEEVMNLGANFYLIKSHFTPTEILDKVNLLLNK